MALAAVCHDANELHSIEPFPDAFLNHDIPGIPSLRVSRVEEVETSYFPRLNARDFLFIDNSHVVRIVGDVNHVYLEILPRLNPGVIFHVNAFVLA
ncbi:MAG: class I SAM-dependent methyltransferase [Chthoniobacterales bacterium]